MPGSVSGDTAYAANQRERQRAEGEARRKAEEEARRRAGAYGVGEGGTTPAGAVPGATGVKVVSAGAGTGVTMDQVNADRAAHGLPPHRDQTTQTAVDADFYGALKKEYETGTGPRPAPVVGPTTIAPTGSTAVPTVERPISVAIPNVGPATAINAPRPVVSERVGGQIIDPGYAAALRARMEGKGPSVADETLKMALDRSARANLGAAAGARGNARAAALREAIMANSETGAQLGQGAAIAKAEEAAAASSQLGQALFKQADLTQGADLASAELGLRGALANQGTEKDVALAKAAIETDIQKLQAEISLQGGIANAEQDARMKALTAELASRSAIVDTQERGATARAQGEIDSRAALANADNALKQQGLDDQRRAVVLDAITRIQATMTGASIADKQMALQVRLAQMGMKQSEINGILGLVSTALAVGGTIAAGPAGGAAGAAVGTLGQRLASEAITDV